MGNMVIYSIFTIKLEMKSGVIWTKRRNNISNPIGPKKSLKALSKKAKSQKYYFSELQ